MKIGITNDHAATELKFKLVEYLKKQGHEVFDYGAKNYESCDYPIMAKNLCTNFESDHLDKGIAICGTGVGISIACNKFNGIRACCCSESVSARLARQHNDANIICFGQRIIGEETAFSIVDTFLTTEFSNGERHIRRISEISDIEKTI